jgi:hypothetical protein
LPWRETAPEAALASKLRRDSDEGIRLFSPTTGFRTRDLLIANGKAKIAPTAVERLEEKH